MVDIELARKFGWKIGDHFFAESVFSGARRSYDSAHFIRSIRRPPLIFNAKYLEESVDWFKGKRGGI